ncbi:MAG: aldose 1-epimerase family protein [Microvirga sp.]
MADTITLTSGALRVSLSPRGAELRSVLDRQGREWLWQGDPASWPRQAPVLFPVVGRCRGDVVRHQGAAYPMSIHGLAPHAEFEIVSRSDERCELRFAASEATRKSYPFDFQLRVSFALSGPTLVQEACVTNAGREVMPSSVGFHPGFPWPLPGCGETRGDHVILFERDEAGPIHRMSSQGIGQSDEATPVAGGRIGLADGLFAQGAMVFLGLRSRKLWFGVPGRPGIGVDMMDMPDLGIWTLPPARFVCIEPWQGYGDPEGFDGELLDKPGVVRLPPGESYTRAIRITFEDERPVRASP